jgi:hypothetical protein
VDAVKLAELLRLNGLKGVYHGEHGTRTLKHLMRSYECLVKDITRVKNRLKALYNSQAIKQRGRELYHASKRQSWLEKLPNPGQRTRAELFFQQVRGKYQKALCHMSSEPNQAAPKDQT